jgi:hypothetical protein
MNRILPTLLVCCLATWSGACSGSHTLPNLCSPDGGQFCTSTDCYTPSACEATCTGDAGAWSAILALPLTCTQNSDCCVVINDCTNQAQVVPASAYATAAAVWPSCSNQCTGCIPPAVSVACVAGQCVGQASTTSQAGMSSCGAGDAGLASPAATTLFSCG